MGLRRSRELKPLSSEHQQALLLAFQLRNGVAGHSDSAGAPRDLDGLAALARRYEDSVFRNHTQAEEDLLGRHLSTADVRRLQGEHAEMRRLLELVRQGPSPQRRAALGEFADLLVRHCNWEERELFPRFEAHIDAEALSVVGHELERRLVLAGRTVSARG
jgi:hypothetical protein